MAVDEPAHRFELAGVEGGEPRGELSAGRSLRDGDSFATLVARPLSRALTDQERQKDEELHKPDEWM
jgi:hypothetical protein